MKLYKIFWKVDASLWRSIVNYHPINQVIAIDAKINIDDNGLYRHKEIEALRDPDAENPSEVEAREKGLSFIKLDGNIGCIVNGAGLAMATMDLVKHYGGTRPIFSTSAVHPIPKKC